MMGMRGRAMPRRQRGHCATGPLSRVAWTLLSAISTRLTWHRSPWRSVWARCSTRTHRARMQRTWSIGTGAEKKGPVLTGPVFVLVVMLWHLFELVLGPGRHGMNVAILVAHEFKVADRHGDRLGAEAEEAADIDDDLTGSARAVHVGDVAHLVVIGAIDGRAFQQRRRQFGG